MIIVRGMKCEDIEAIKEINFLLGLSLEWGIPCVLSDAARSRSEGSMCVGKTYKCRNCKE